MKIIIRESGPVKIVEFEGSLDTNTSEEAQQQLDVLVGQGATKILANFEKLDFVSSSGLRILLVIAKKLSSINGELAISNTNETVREVFAISGFDTILKVYDKEEEAIKNLTGE